MMECFTKPHGAYSRRINIQHRLVDQVYEKEKVVKIFAGERTMNNGHNKAVEHNPAKRDVSPLTCFPPIL